ncbi:MAG: shikimate kinase AroK [Gammaproteobacteria bacterium]|jgi:shikimate kinase|nr:shikimate kinase AroK [Gammaproteobacteria bacterium]
MRIHVSRPLRLFLVGPMGVGKTTIGRMLARELGLRFVDCDEEIEYRAGANIAWIFDVEGETGFRMREMHVLDDLTQEDNVLVATGGGAVLNDENRRYLKERGIVVHLDTSVDLLVKRTANDKKRPLLQNGNPRAILEKIKRDRDPLYREVSNVRVFVGHNSSRKAVLQILENLKKEGLTQD